MSFESIFSDPPLNANHLDNLVAKTDIQMFNHDLDPLERQERIRLVNHHINTIKVAVHAVTAQIWALLQEFSEVLLLILSSDGISAQRNLVFLRWKIK